MLGMGICVHFSLSLRTPSGANCAGTVHAATISMSLYVCWFYSVQNVLIPWCPPSPLALIIFLPPLLQSSLSPEGKDLMKTSSLGLSVPGSLILFKMPSCIF